MQGAVILDDAINSNSTTKAATANAVLKVFQVVDNAGIGNFAKDISNSDLNNLDGTGIYRGNNLTNRPGTGPTTEWYYVLNMKHAAAYKVQIAYRLDNGNNQIFRRVQNNGVWSQWVEEVAVDPTGTINLRHLPDASTTAEGITQLNDATNSNSTTQAATANAVKKVMDFVRNAGIGDTAAIISNTDLNVLDGTGFCMGLNLTNAPRAASASEWWFVINMKHNSTYKMQIAVMFAPTTSAYYQRSCTNGTWSEWVQQATYDSNGKIATANLPDTSTSTKGIVQLNDNTNNASTTQAATANAVKKVMDVVVGAGVGDIAKDISNTDLNVLDGSGFFKGQQLTNNPLGGPSGTWYYIFQMKHAASYKVQTAYRLDNVNNQMFKRVLSNNVWSTWTEISTTKYVDDNIATAVKAHTDLTNNPHNVTTKQVNIYTPAVDAAASGDDIPEGVTLGSIPPNATGYPEAWGTIQNFKQSNVRCMQYWYDTGENSNRQKPQYRTWYTGTGQGWSPWTELETSAGAQAKVDATQVFKLTQDNGHAKSLTATANLDTINDTGYYFVNSTTLVNAPVAMAGTLEVVLGDSKTTLQTYMTIGNPTRLFYRQKSAGSWNPWKESATVDKVQVAKITADSGTDKQAVAPGEDLPAKALTWGAGFHTFYAAGNVLNGPDASTHCRGYFSRDNGNLGYLFAVDGHGKTHVNRYNAGSWSGWKTSTIEQDVGFIGTLFGKVGTNNRGPVAVLRAGNNDTDGFGVALGGGGYTVLGGGESAAAILSALAAADVNKESAEVAAEADVFISPGTNTTTPATRKTSIFKASGNVILPYASYVSVNAGVEQTFPSGVSTKFKFTAIITDNQGEFNTTSWRFVAKDDGVYEFRLAADLTAQVVSNNIAFNTYRNGTQGSTLTIVGPGTPYVVGTTLMKLNAGDYIEVYVSSDQSVYIPSANLTIAKLQ